MVSLMVLRGVHLIKGFQVGGVSIWDQMFGKYCRTFLTNWKPILWRFYLQVLTISVFFLYT